MIEPGQVVAAGQAAIRLAHTAEKEAVVALPEALVDRARFGTARVSLWSAPGSNYRATMTATVTLSDTAAERAAWVPLAALLDQGGGPCVWVVAEDGAPALRPVRVAGYEGGDALVENGLAEGERVVRVGAHKLDAGQRVRVVDALQF